MGLDKKFIQKIAMVGRRYHIGASRTTWKCYDEMDAIYRQRPASKGKESDLDTATSPHAEFYVFLSKSCFFFLKKEKKTKQRLCELNQSEILLFRLVYSANDDWSQCTARVHMLCAMGYLLFSNQVCCMFSRTPRDVCFVGHRPRAQLPSRDTENLLSERTSTPTPSQRSTPGT